MKLQYIFAALLCLCLLISPATAAGGSGTADNPYIIQTPAELQSIQNDLSAYYRLANDIDLSSVTWTPIGSTSSPFMGSLDGNGHTIKNLHLSSTTTNSGLFSALTSGATIKDLTLLDCTFESTSYICGGLIGCIIMSSTAHNTATLSNIDMTDCSVSSSRYNVAVLCSRIYTNSVVSISDCTFTNCIAESTGSHVVGIIFATCESNSDVEITSCSISNSYTKASADNIGILGCSVSNSNLVLNDCLVDSCISEGPTYHLGGLCGVVGGGNIIANNCIVKNSILKGKHHVGGLFGSAAENSIITANSCSLIESTVIGAGYWAGGIISQVYAEADGIITDCIVKDCTILTNNAAAGICPVYG